MKFPEHCSHTIEKLLDRNIEKYHKKIIDYDTLVNKAVQIIRYGLEKKYIQDTGLAFDIFNRIFSSKKFYKEFQKRMKDWGKDQQYSGEERTGPFPLFDPELLKFLREGA
jgi:hypothetical protein